MEDTRVICIKSIEPFLEGKEYNTDSRLFKNKDNPNDNQVMVIESETPEGLLNCYFVPLDKMNEHFKVI
jgi:hypothetical protein